MTSQEYSIGSHISLLNRHVQSFMARELAEQHIGGGQYAFLLVLYQGDGLSQEQLAVSLSIDKGTTARALQALEESGYVRRPVSPTDRRAHQVYLTEKAWQVQPAVQAALTSLTDVLLNGFSEKDRMISERFLQRMADNVVRMMRGEPDIFTRDEALPVDTRAASEAAAPVRVSKARRKPRAEREQKAPAFASDEVLI